MSKQISDEQVELMVNALGIKTEMGCEFVRVAAEAIRLFDTKQMDYGSDNITSNGELGCAIRLQDKVSRMKNYLISSLHGGIKLEHESMEDTYLDSANYCLIALLLRRGKWK